MQIYKHKILKNHVNFSIFNQNKLHICEKMRTFAYRVK